MKTGRRIFQLFFSLEVFLGLLIMESKLHTVGSQGKQEEDLSRSFSEDSTDEDSWVYVDKPDFKESPQNLSVETNLRFTFTIAKCIVEDTPCYRIELCQLPEESKGSKRLFCEVCEDVAIRLLGTRFEYENTNKHSGLVNNQLTCKNGCSKMQLEIVDVILGPSTNDAENLQGTLICRDISFITIDLQDPQEELAQQYASGEKNSWLTETQMIKFAKFLRTTRKAGTKGIKKAAGTFRDFMMAMLESTKD